MKHLISILVVVLLALAPLSALAVSYAGEEMVVTQTACSKPAPAPTASEVKAEADRVLRGVKASEKSVKAEIGRVDKTLKENTDSVSKMVEAVGVLATKTGENTVAIGAVATKVDGTTTAVNGLKDSFGSLKSWMITGFVLLIIGIVWLLFFKKSNNKQVLDKLDEIGRKVDDVPEKTAVRIETLKPVVIEFTDICGKNVKFTPKIVDNEYVSLFVPKTVTTPVADPTNAIRARYGNVGDLRRSTSKALKWYFGATAPGAPALATEAERQQIALINALAATDELKIS